MRMFLPLLDMVCHFRAHLSYPLNRAKRSLVCSTDQVSNHGRDLSPIEIAQYSENQAAFCKLGGLMISAIDRWVFFGI